jgi:predicted nuclease of predicted toxin-antitoxin system
MRLSPSFVADESVDYNLIKFLRNNGLTIFSIQEDASSIKDNFVLQIAREQDAILITEDKDFGELVFKLKMPHKGLLLLRINGTSLQEKCELVLQFIIKFSPELVSNFAVIKQRKLRIRKLN